MTFQRSQIFKISSKVLKLTKTYKTPTSKVTTSSSQDMVKQPPNTPQSTKIKENPSKLFHAQIGFVFLPRPRAAGNAHPPNRVSHILIFAICEIWSGRPQSLPPGLESSSSKKQQTHQKKHAKDNCNQIKMRHSDQSENETDVHINPSKEEKDLDTGV